MPQKPNRVPWMLENPWSAVGNPTSALGPSGSSFGPSGSSFGPSSLTPIGIHHLLLSSLTTGFKSVGSWFSTCAVPPQKTHVLRLAVSTSERPSHELTLIGHFSDWCQQCLMLLVGCQERHPACKNWVAGCWHRYLSAARCILACGPVKK